jgi:hypothetical protein
MLVSRTKTLRFGSFVKFRCMRGMTDLTYQKFGRPLLCAMNTFHTLPFETRLSYGISFSVVRTIRRAYLMCLGLSSDLADNLHDGRKDISREVKYFEFTCSHENCNEITGDHAWSICF